jgi:4-hydroxy-tetrahydrodipicolinate synthase
MRSASWPIIPSVLLSDEERALLMRLSLEHAAGRVPVIVTISHFSTDLVTKRAKAAEEQGASMVMMMPPYHGSGLYPAPPGISSISRR